MVSVPLLVFALMAADENPVPKIPVGKETTIVTGPLTKEGYIDYETVVNERLSQGVTPETNANVLIWKLLGPRPEGRNMPAEFYKWLGIQEPPEKGEYLRDLGGYLKEHANVEGQDVWDLYGELERISQRPWVARDYPHLAGWLQASEKPLALAVEASKRPEYFNPLVSSHTERKPGGLLGALLPSAQKCRTIAMALRCRAMLRAGEGQLDEAWQDLLACHRLGRLVARGGTLIEMLVGIAIDAIASNAEMSFLERASKDRDAKQIRAWLKDLQTLPPMPAMADKLDVAERFFYLDSVQMVRRGGFPALEALSGSLVKPEEDPPAGLPGIDFAPALRTGNQFYDRMVAAARLKDRAEREKAWESIDKEVRNTRVQAVDPTWLVKGVISGAPAEKIVGKRIGDTLIGLLLPATRKLQQASDRCEQTQRNLHIAFALVAYQREHGNYPATLNALAPAILPAIPGDLFSGKPLIYRSGEKGFLVYSVGVNGKDEGGRWYDDDPPGDDPSVRLPLPPLKPRK
jgi:hypothetical protein